MATTDLLSHQSPAPRPARSALGEPSGAHRSNLGAPRARSALWLVALPALALVLVSEPARADGDGGATPAPSAAPVAEAPPPEQPAWEREVSTRRSGVIVGLQGNIGPAMASGYPLDLKKIGRQSYYTETGVGLGATGFLWLGVALKDWLSVGVGGSLDGIVAGDLSGWGPGGAFRIEAFPLWPFGGRARDVGVTIDAGTSALYVAKSGPDATYLIDGGAASYIGGGVFYEGLRFWRISAGPGIYAGYTWSDTVRHGAVTLDFRMTLYTGSEASP